MNPQEIKTLLDNGLIITRHAYDKMLAEKITEQQIREALTSGLSSKIDSSNRNNKAFAWNKAHHNTISFKGLTVVFCESKERACLIISAYHGIPHNYLSNPYNRKY